MSEGAHPAFLLDNPPPDAISVDGEAAPLDVGHVLSGTYRLTSVIGRGSMGTVFEAEHLRLGKPFAVKLMRSEEFSQARARARFRDEARALAAVSSDYVVGVVDCGEDGAVPYLVMERLAGSDVRRVLKEKGRLSVELALRIALAASRGLSAIHRAGLVHRDLKPANLFLTRTSDGRDIVKILDLGVVRTSAGNGTKGGTLVGTIRYMAPEQLGDSRAVGPHTDVYALGCILHECLTGEPPHAGATVEELMFDILHRDPVAVRSRREEVSAELAELIAWALARVPSERCPSATVFSRALEAVPEFSAAADAADGTTRDGTDGDFSQVPAPRPLGRRLASRATWIACLVSLGLGAVLGSLGATRSRSVAAPANTIAKATVAAAVCASPEPATSPPVNSAGASAAPGRPGGCPADAKGASKVVRTRPAGLDPWSESLVTQNPYAK